MSKIKEKRFKTEWVIIAILTVSLIGSVSFIIYDKTIKKDEIKQEKSNKDDTVNITAEMDIKMTDFSMIENIVRLSDLRDDNIFADANMRIEYLSNVIYKNKLHNMGGYEYSQGFAYVSHEMFQNKYMELFGDLYDLNNDLLTVDKHILLDCSQFPDLPDGSYVCFNPVYKISEFEYDFKLTNKVLDGNVYILSGEYVMVQVGSDDVKEIGTFEIKYVIKDDSFALSSVVLKKN